jgi:hypothetical protein
MTKEKARKKEKRGIKSSLKETKTNVNKGM